jgi:hypothetical protein
MSISAPVIFSDMTGSNFNGNLEFTEKRSGSQIDPGPSIKEPQGILKGALPVNLWGRFYYRQ